MSVHKFAVNNKDYGGKEMTVEEINKLLQSSPDELYRALLKEFGRYVYVIVFNKLRSCGKNEDVEWSNVNKVDNKKWRTR